MLNFSQSILYLAARPISNLGSAGKNGFIRIAMFSDCLSYGFGYLWEHRVDWRVVFYGVQWGRIRKG